MTAQGDGDDDPEEDEWRFSLDDVGEDGVTGSFGPAESIEPQEIDRENAVFVLLGVLLAIGLIALLVT